MRIDRLHAVNFKCFEDLSFDLHPEFTLFVGENGAGKTSILSAAAVALGVWDQNPEVRQSEKTWRKIYEDEVRLTLAKSGDRSLFEAAESCEIRAEWNPGAGQPPLLWRRCYPEPLLYGSGGMPITGAINAMVAAAAQHRRPAPVLAFYGAGRTWLPTGERITPPQTSARKPRQWDGYRDCLQERIRLNDLNQWFRDEAAARDEKGGWRPGYKTVVRAILNCVPDAEDILWDADRLEICLKIGGATVPFSLLSDGQKSMAALVADLARRAVTLNSFLFADSKEIPPDPELPIVLAQTPGVVLIDELDVHLHPRWQRRVAADLRRTFPRVQFICTSHSPQLFGELPPENIRVYDRKTRLWAQPIRSLGLDSSRVLEEAMSARSRNAEIQKQLRALAEVIDAEDISRARELLADIEQRLGADDPEVTHHRALIALLQETA